MNQEDTPLFLLVGDIARGPCNRELCLPGRRETCSLPRHAGILESRTWRARPMLVDVREALRASAQVPDEAALAFAGAPRVPAAKCPSLWEGDRFKQPMQAVWKRGSSLLRHLLSHCKRRTMIGVRRRLLVRVRSSGPAGEAEGSLIPSVTDSGENKYEHFRHCGSRSCCFRSNYCALHSGAFGDG